MLESGKRIFWIDSVKAILICLVVLGHLGSVFRPVIYLFHIPAFFFVSGFLCNYRERSFSQILLSQRFLVYAIVFWNFIYIIINCYVTLQSGCGIMHANQGINVDELLIRPLIGVVSVYYPKATNANPICAQFWFIWILILLKICYSFLCKIGNRELVIISLSVIIVNAILYHYMLIDANGFLLFYFSRFLISFPFFVIGGVLRRTDLIQRIPKMNLCLICSGVLFCFLVLFTHRTGNWDVDIFHFRLGNSVILFYITAFVGTTSLLLLSVVLFNWNHNLIRLISEGTLLILAMHMGLILLMEDNKLLNSDITRISEMAIILAVTIPFIILSKRYFPVALGKKNNYGKL